MKLASVIWIPFCYRCSAFNHFGQQQIEGAEPCDPAPVIGYAAACSFFALRSVAIASAIQLFDVAVNVEARVVLVGDRRQHRSVAAGEPLKLLEERAGLPVAEVTEIMRQTGDYRKAAVALSEGKVADGFAELDRLGWIREVTDADRNKQLAAAYLAAVAEKKKNGEHKSALVVSPTHAEAAKITQTIRELLKTQKKLGVEHTVTAWLPAHLTDAENAMQRPMSQAIC
jgi:ATP-dependent exoDNAse (exonuclease V) alpha subunit